MARDGFFRILHVIRANDKTTRNQLRSTDKLAPIRNVFESIISTFQMAYTPNEHIIIDEQLVLFRGTCLFHMFIKSKPGKYGIKLWVAADAKNFYACNMQVIHWQEWWIREKKQDFRVVKYMVCHMYGTGSCVTTDKL